MSKSLNADIEGKTIMFMSVDNAAASAARAPGDVMRMHVEVTRYRDVTFSSSTARHMSNDKVAAECDFAAMVVSPQPDGRYGAKSIPPRWSDGAELGPKASSSVPIRSSALG